MSVYSKILPILTVILFASTQQVSAKDLGVIGKTYQIKEQDAVEQIKKKLMVMQENGELEKLKDKAIKKSLHTLKNPKPNDSITTAKKRSQTLHNPTKTYDAAVTDDEGRILLAAGSKVNPLDYMSLSKKIIFFDGRDKEQVKAVKKMVKQQGAKLKPVLIAGSWFDISKAWGQQVYFDQGSYLTAQFNIKEVPAIVSQEGKSLKIEVIPAKDLGK